MSSPVASASTIRYKISSSSLDKVLTIFLLYDFTKESDFDVALVDSSFLLPESFFVLAFTFVLSVALVFSFKASAFSLFSSFTTKFSADSLASAVTASNEAAVAKLANSFSESSRPNKAISPSSGSIVISYIICFICSFGFVIATFVAMFSSVNVSTSSLVNSP